MLCTSDRKLPILVSYIYALENLLTQIATESKSLMKRPKQTSHEGSIYYPNRDRNYTGKVRVELLGAASVGDYLPIFKNVRTNFYLYFCPGEWSVAEGRNIAERQQRKGIWYVFFSDTWEHARVRRCE